MRKMVGAFALLVLLAPLAAVAAPPSQAVGKSMAAVAQILNPVQRAASQPDDQLDAFFQSLHEGTSLGNLQVNVWCSWTCAPCGHCDPGDHCVRICQ